MIALSLSMVFYQFQKSIYVSQCINWISLQEKLILFSYPVTNTRITRCNRFIKNWRVIHSILYYMTRIQSLIQIILLRKFSKA